MIDTSALLTGRQLVDALLQIGVGRWGKDAVRQWLREEPPCPVAELGDQGKPHRYRLTPVLEWLRARSMAERAKGYTRADGDDLIARIDAALRGDVVPSRSEAQTESAQVDFLAPIISTQSAAENAADASQPSPAVSPAKLPAGFQVDWLKLSDVESLLAVLQGRDPRNWKAAEEAMTLRRERLVEERKLIPLDELEAGLDLHTEHTRRGFEGARAQLKQALRDFVPLERQHQLDRAIDEIINRTLERLASTDDLDQLVTKGVE